MQNNLNIDFSIHGPTIGGISAVVFVLVDLSMSLLIYVICLIQKMFNNCTFIKLSNAMPLHADYYKICSELTHLFLE